MLVTAAGIRPRVLAVGESVGMFLVSRWDKDDAEWYLDAVPARVISSKDRYPSYRTHGPKGCPHLCKRHYSLDHGGATLGCCEWSLLPEDDARLLDALLRTDALAHVRIP